MHRATNFFNIELKVIDPGIAAQLPGYATPGSVAVDLRAVFDYSEIILPAGGTRDIHTGIAIHIKDPNTAGIILPRSGLGSQQGVVLANLVGLIDADYQGELYVPLWNRSDKDYIIERHERVAQLLFIPVTRAQFSIVENFVESQRGTQGFGSTGKF